jgi:hypothetical protein
MYKPVELYGQHVGSLLDREAFLRWNLHVALLTLVSIVSVKGLGLYKFGKCIF